MTTRVEITADLSGPVPAVAQLISHYETLEGSAFTYFCIVMGLLLAVTLYLVLDDLIPDAINAFYCTTKAKKVEKPASGRKRGRVFPGSPVKLYERRDSSNGSSMSLNRCRESMEEEQEQVEEVFEAQAAWEMPGSNSKSKSIVRVALDLLSVAHVLIYVVMQITTRALSSGRAQDFVDQMTAVEWSGESVDSSRIR